MYDNNKAQVKTMKSHTTSHTLDTFNVVIQLLYRASGLEQTYQIRSFAQLHLKHLNLPTHAHLEVADWLDGSSRNLSCIQLSFDHLCNLLHLFYVALCEYRGPTEALTLVHKAVSQACQDPHTCRFSPHQLIQRVEQSA